MSEHPREDQFAHQPTMQYTGGGIESQDTMNVNAPRTDKGESHGKPSKGGKGMDMPVQESTRKEYLATTLNELIITNKDGYFKKLNQYQSDPNCRIDPIIRLAGDEEEIENYIVNERIYTTTYIQYIDVYESTTATEEDLEEEEIEYVEIPKYVTKYKPKVVIESVKKIVEVPSGEEIKQPKYTSVDVPYIIPTLIDNEILVVLRKIVQPEIEITNDILEIQVEKYVPKLIPVNVYVPRYFGISAKVKGVAEETLRFVDLTQEQINELMKELNPHLEELRLFNETQMKRMEEYIKESQLQSKMYDFIPPRPLAISYDESGNCKSFEYSEFNKIKEAYLSTLIR